MSMSLRKRFRSQAPNNDSRNRAARPCVEALDPRQLLTVITVTGIGDDIANDGVAGEHDNVIHGRGRRSDPHDAPDQVIIGSYTSQHVGDR